MKNQIFAVTICFFLLLLSLVANVICCSAYETHADENESVHDCIDPMVGSVR